MVEEENLQVMRDNLEGSSGMSISAQSQMLKIRAQRGLMTCPKEQSERSHMEARLRLLTLQKLRAQYYSRWSLHAAMFLLLMG